MGREEASDKLRNLAEKISNGRVELQSGENSIELRPAEQLEFELEVEEEEDGDISIEIELEWPKESSGSGLKIK